MRNVILVDDNTALLHVVKVALSMNYNIVDFFDSKKAIAYLNDTNNNWDVIISDYKMPQYNGVDVLKTARDTKPDAIRVLLTGFADEVEIGREKALFDKVLDKNLLKDISEIINIIEELCIKRSVA